MIEKKILGGDSEEERRSRCYKTLVFMAAYAFHTDEPTCTTK